MQPEKKNKYGYVPIRNGCKSKKDLRNWIRAQNKLRLAEEEKA